jgi:aminoglycoside/choline kinase family phosphotransferase
MTEPDLSRALEALYGAPPPKTQLTKLRGDASTRSYFRLEAIVETSTEDRPRSVIVMKLPEDALKSDEGGAQPESERLPFLEVAELLQARGLPVPTIYVEDLARGVILLEDLGDVTFEQSLRNAPRADWASQYETAVDLLAEMHERCIDLPAGSIVSRRRFDRELLDWELDHFRQWGLEALHGPVDSGGDATLRTSFSAIADAIEAMPVGFVHRDYQSKNLMVGKKGGLTLLDFQDALVGPRVYDLVALLCDSYVALDLELQHGMIDRYAALRRIDPAALRREFWTVALHRKLKDSGRFVFIDRVRGNPDFLEWYPQSLVYVGRAAAELGGFEALSGLLRRTIPGYPDAVSKPASSAE